MSWETRERGTRYYTRSRRIDGRTVREYIGSGPAGEDAARADAEARARRQAEREEVRRIRADVAAADARMLQADAAAETVLRGALLAAGYRRHNGGEWRRRRD